jgi:hypothetical protein
MSKKQAGLGTRKKGKCKMSESVIDDRCITAFEMGDKGQVVAKVDADEFSSAEREMSRYSAKAPRYTETRIAMPRMHPLHLLITTRRPNADLT